MWQLFALAVLGAIVYLGYYLGVNLGWFWQGVIVSIIVISYINTNGYDDWFVFSFVPNLLSIVIVVMMGIGDYTSGKFSNVVEKSEVKVVEVTKPVEKTPPTHYQETEPANTPLVDTDAIGTKVNSVVAWFTSKPFEKK